MRRSTNVLPQEAAGSAASAAVACLQNASPLFGLPEVFILARRVGTFGVRPAGCVEKDAVTGSEPFGVFGQGLFVRLRDHHLERAGLLESGGFLFSFHGIGSMWIL